MDAADEVLAGDRVRRVDLADPPAEPDEFGVRGAVGVQDADGDVRHEGVELPGVVGPEELDGELFPVERGRT
ncbi:hypothetical protein [Streptomyces sp. NPDC057336]|uniref:hypothetical protein n=1 Tax=Streptomyces sp. NPDC057336 TaxID=3346102 RepID=UPI003643204C